MKQSTHVLQINKEYLIRLHGKELNFMELFYMSFFSHGNNSLGGRLFLKCMEYKKIIFKPVVP